jgi:hypothetical protein
VFDLVELVGERFDLLHLVVDHLDELRDFLRRVDDRLNSVGRVVNDPFCARADTLTPSVTSAGAMNFFMVCLSLCCRQSRERIYHQAKKARCIRRTRFNEVRRKGGERQRNFRASCQDIQKHGRVEAGPITAGCPFTSSARLRITSLRRKPA